MPNELKIEPLQKQIEGLKKAFENGRFGDALVGALNTGNGLLQQRVFTENKDVTGKDFGKYVGRKKKISAAQTEKLLSKASKTDKKRIKAAADLELTAYERKRVNKGRQIAKKDLEFTGGTRRAIETVIENDKSAVLHFNNEEAAKIARGQEQQIHNIRSGGKGTTKGSGAPKIFGLSDAEKETVIDQGIELIKEILKP